MSSNLMIHILMPGVRFTYRVIVTSGQTTTPKFTFAAGAPATNISWGDGSALEAVTSGVELTHTYSIDGTYMVQLVGLQQGIYLTEIDINSDRVIDAVTNIRKFSNLTSFNLNTNSAWVQDIQSWNLPSKLITMNIYSTNVTGDIGQWVLPSTLQTFYAMACNGLYCDITSWVLPASLINFAIYSSLYIAGDISAWVLPAGLLIFQILGTLLTGCPILTSMVSIQSIFAQDTHLIEASVDLWLSRCVAREASTTYATPTLNLGGNNSAPSAAGLIDKATLVGAGWIVTTNP